MCVLAVDQVYKYVSHVIVPLTFSQSTLKKSGNILVLLKMSIFGLFKSNTFVTLLSSFSPIWSQCVIRIYIYTYIKSVAKMYTRFNRSCLQTFFKDGFNFSRKLQEDFFSDDGIRCTINERLVQQSNKMPETQLLFAKHKKILKWYFKF